MSDPPEMEERREKHREKFNRAQKQNLRFTFTRERLQQYIKRVLNAKKAGRKKKPADYVILKKYDVLKTQGQVVALVRRGSCDPYVRFIHAEEVFRAIEEAHGRTCHGGEKRMYLELKRTVANVTRQQVDRKSVV